MGVSSTNTMEARKVQLSGGTTYTVSLPKSWAQEYGIEAGSLLHLRPEGDGTLVVDATDEDSHERTIRIDVSTYDIAEIREAVVASYMVGFDKVTLTDRNGHTDDARRCVTTVVGDLMGVTVEETTDTRLVVRSLLDGSQISVRKSAIQLRLVTLAMQRDAATAVIEHDYDLAERVIDRDTEADKLFALLTRFFRRTMVDLRVLKQLGSSRPDLFEYYYVARQFERIADHAEKVATIATNCPEPLDQEFVEAYGPLAKRARTLVGDASNVILGDADIETAYQSIPKCDELVGEIESYERSQFGDRTFSTAYESGLLLDSVKRTAEYGSNIAELAIQRSIRTDEVE